MAKKALINRMIKKIKLYNKYFKNPTFVLTLRLNPTISDISALDKYFELSRKLYNALLHEALKRLNLMKQSKKYQKARKISDTKLKTEAFNNLKTEFKFTEYDLITFSTPLRVNEFKQIDSNTVQTLASRAFEAVNRILIGKANKVNFKGKDYGLDSIRGASNRQGIKYRDGFLQWNKLNIPIIIKKNDVYAEMCFEHDIKYCAIKREIIKGKPVYYIQIYFKGFPPVKYNKDGTFKHKLGIGEVGIDIGTSTIAYVSDVKCGLKELCEGLNNIEHQKRLLSRKLDRSKRSNNTNNYNENGTIKKGIINDKGKKEKLVWIKSNNYKKIQSKLRDIQRKLASQRKQKHEEMANYILSLGNIIKVELMNYDGLQKRAKKTTINKKTGRFNKKKRFGKSIANKAPSMLLNIINRKLLYQKLYLFEINTKEVKASQYNPITDEYKKKELSERWNYFKYDNKDIEIQRDLMSAFIIKNVIIDECLNLNIVNREKCLDEFNNFQDLHDKEISDLKNLKNKNNKRFLSSMGI